MKTIYLSIIKFIFNRLLIILTVFIIPVLSFSQEDSLDIYELDLTQLSKLKITTASKISQKISEIPLTAVIITEAQIKEAGYLTLDEVLSDLAGFQFRNIQGFNSYSFQRGIPNQNNLTLLLIDGIQINELNSGGFYGGGQYNLNNVERIEVIYGPSSVAYGTNAVSGIINIVTKSAMAKRFEINSTAGSFNTYSSDINYCYVNEKQTFGVSVAGMLKNSDKANLKGEAGDYNWTDLMDNFEKDKTLDFKVQYKDFILGSNYIYKQASNATSTISNGTIYRDYGTSWNIQFLNNYIKYNKDITEKVHLSSVIYNRNATVLSNTVYFVVDTAQVGYYRPNNLTGIENIVNYKFNNNFSVAGGLIAEYESLSEENTLSFSDSPLKKPPKPDKPVMLNNYLVSAFAEPQLTLFKNLYISGGLRFDQSSIYNQVLTPRAGILYKSGVSVIRLSYAEAFRAPKPWDYSDGTGNPGLLPEKMKSLETAFSFSVSNNYKFDLIGYKNKLLNAITKEFTGEGTRWINKGEINTDGVELTFTCSSKKISSFINYTYNHSYDEFGEDIPEISKHSGNAGITLSVYKHLKLNLRANYSGKRENQQLISTTNSFYVDPYIIFHGSVSLLNYNGFTVQLSVRNILNEEYYHTSNRDPDRYRQPQRTLLLSIGYSLANNR